MRNNGERNGTMTSALGAAVVEGFRREGYYLHRGLFPRAQAEEAAAWLRAQDGEKLAKSWTEQEPAVPLAVFSVIHKADHPISVMANDRAMLAMAGELMGDEVYIWASKVNLKAAWCGTAEYYHQDLVYWKDRGYPRDEMLSCMVVLDPHTLRNAALHVLPGTHRLGFIEHQPFININGLAKYMVPPATLDRLHREHGLLAIEAEPGDVLFFHTSLVHGSAHNISPHPRMIILSQLNTVGNEPREVSTNARDFNLRRAESELREAERRLAWFKKKYEDQLHSAELTFAAPIPEQERAAGPRYDA
jgi:ectoine hydroxylase